MVTLKKINDMASRYGCGIFQGKEYFYFYFKDKNKAFKDSMVLVRKLNSLTLEMWEKELQLLLKDENINGLEK